MLGNVLGLGAAVAVAAVLDSALIEVCPFDLADELGVEFVQDIAQDEVYVGLRDGSFACVSGEEDLKEQVEYFEDLTPDGQI